MLLFFIVRDPHVIGYFIGRWKLNLINQFYEIELDLNFTA